MQNIPNFKLKKSHKNHKKNHLLTLFTIHIDVPVFEYYYIKGSWPAEYHDEKKVKKEQPTSPKESPLDPNHSHFIMVDDGSQNIFGTEIPFRIMLEKAISEFRTSKEKSGETSFYLRLKIVNEFICEVSKH